MGKNGILDDMYHTSPNGMVITDKDGIVGDVNDSFERITGYSRDEILGSNMSKLSSGLQKPEFYQSMWDSLNENCFWQGKIWNKRKSGDVYQELLTITAKLDDDGLITHHIAEFTDISDIFNDKGDLVQLAFFDSLTQLANRALFMDRLHQGIEEAKRHQHQCAILFIDLDDFKKVNDYFGHKRGDELLIQVAQQLKKDVRSMDTVARIGGDEFTLLLNDISNTDIIIQMADKIRETLYYEFSHEGIDFVVTPSIGIALYPDHGLNADDVLAAADQAMYAAKRLGKNKVSLSDQLV